MAMRIAHSRPGVLPAGLSWTCPRERLAGQVIEVTRPPLSLIAWSLCVTHDRVRVAADQRASGGRRPEREGLFEGAASGVVQTFRVGRGASGGPEARGGDLCGEHGREGVPAAGCEQVAQLAGDDLQLGGVPFSQLGMGPHRSSPGRAPGSMTSPSTLHPDCTASTK